MSYVENIPPSDLHKYEVVKDWFIFMKDEIDKLTSTGKILSFSTLEISYKIIESDVMFVGGSYDYSIRFDYCYFKKSISFAQGKFLKDITFSNCYIDDTISCMLPTNFHGHFFIISTYLKTLLILEGNFKKCIWNVGGCKECLQKEILKICNFLYLIL